MRKLILTAAILACLAPAALANQGAAANGSTNVTRTLPNSSPFTSVGSWTMEMRVSRSGALSTGATLAEVSAHFKLFIFTSSDNLTLFDWTGGSSAVAAVSLTGLNDFTVQVVRDNTNNLYILTVASLDGATVRTAQGTPMSAGAQNFGSQQLCLMSNCDPTGYMPASSALHFFRWKQGVPSINWLSGRAPVQITPPAAFDLINYEFEGNATDTSGRGLNGTVTGAGGYASTTNASPRFVTKGQSVRTTDAIPLDGDNFIVTGDAAITSYLWEFVSGPSTATPISATSASTTATGGSRGEYVHRLTVTDANANSANSTISTGSVVVDADNIVQYADSSVGYILGPRLWNGAETAWPKYGFYEKYIGNIVGTNFPAKPPDVTLTGTVSVTNGSAAVVGSGTAFTREINTAAPGELAYYIQDAGGTYQLFTIASVTDDTHLTLASNWTGTTASGRAHSYDPDGTGQFNSFRRYWVYYDLPQTLYSLYYTTGLTRFRDQARKAADSWWASDLVNYGATDPTTNAISPRESNATGLTLRALDGKPEYWDWCKRYAEWAFDNYVTQRINYPGIYFGAREGGYSFVFQTNIAAVLPDTYTLYGNGTLAASTGTETGGAAIRSTMRANALSGAVNFYCRLQRPDGSWRWGDALFEPSGQGQAEQVWHSAFIVGGLHQMLRLMDLDSSYKSANAAAYNTIRYAIITGAAHAYLHHFNRAAFTDLPAVNSRYTVYYLYDAFAGNAPPTSVATTDFTESGGIPGARQNSAPLLHVFGAAYYLSGVEQYKTWGDELYGSYWGGGSLAASGLNDDGYGGQYVTGYTTSSIDPRGAPYSPSNRRSEDLNQAVQRGGTYTAYRVQAADVPANWPALASAGPDQYLDTGTTSTTVSCAGKDPEGGSVTTLATVSFGAGVTLTNATSATVTVNGLTNGLEAAVRCAVTDAAGQVTYDFATIEVKSTAGLTANGAVSVAASDQSLSVGTTSTSVSATVSGATVAPASTSIFQVGGNAAATIATPTASGTSPSFSVTGLQNGKTYVFRLVSRDNSIQTVGPTTTAFRDVVVTVASGTNPRMRGGGHGRGGVKIQ